MTPLRDHLVDYLRIRRALGSRLERDEYELGRFVDHLADRGIETITVEDALAWATRSSRATVTHPMRLRMIRGFTRYLQSIDVPVEVPASDLLPDRRRRAVPYLYTDAEISALMQATGTLRTPHRAATVRTMIGLLAVTGMRAARRSALTATTSTRLPASSRSARGSSRNHGSSRCTPRPSRRSARTSSAPIDHSPRARSSTRCCSAMTGSGSRATSPTTPSASSPRSQVCVRGRNGAGPASTIYATRWPSAPCWTHTAPENRSARGSSLCPPTSGTRTRATHIGISKPRRS